MAKLSHTPSTANLLAQYTSLKGRPAGDHRGACVGDFKHDSNTDSYYFYQTMKTTSTCGTCWHRVNPQTFIYLTVKPTSAASYQNVTLAPSLHVW